MKFALCFLSGKATKVSVEIPMVETSVFMRGFRAGNLYCVYFRIPVLKYSVSNLISIMETCSDISLGVSVKKSHWKPHFYPSVFFPHGFL